jgi:predicted phage tail protein
LIDLEEDDFGEETDAVLAAAAQAEKMMELLSASQRPAPAQFAQAEKRLKPSHGASPPRARPASAQPQPTAAAAQPALQPAANATAASADNVPKPAAVARAISAPAATSRGEQQTADLTRHASAQEMGHVCSGAEIAQKRQEALKRKQAAALKKKIEAKRLKAQMLKKRKAAERRLALSRARSQAGQQSQDSQDWAGLPSSAAAGVVFSQGSSGQPQSQVSG